MDQASLMAQGNASTGADSTRKPALFVSTTLDTWECPAPQHYAGDVTLNEIPHRKLDPDFYAWLRHRMTQVKGRADKGAIPPETFHALRDKFNGIHTWAVQHLGESELRQAVQNLDAKRYTPPKAHPDHCFQGIHQFPEDQSHWPPALQAIWNEIVRDLTCLGIDRDEAASVAQGIVEVLVDHQPVAKPVEPAQAALPF